MARKKRSLGYYAAKAVRYDDDIFVCAGDVESEGLGGKLLMVQWGCMGAIKTATGPDMVARFFDDFLEMPKPAIWYFHFAQYDWRYFIDYLETSDLIVEIGMRTETDIYEIRCKRSEKDAWCIMRDSYAIWSQKLEDLAKTFCPELPKLEIDIENFDPENPEHIEYAKRDVAILLVGLPRLFDLINEHFSVNAGATAAGTAMKAWQKSLPYEAIYNCSKWGPEEMFVRQGYYGGLVFLTSNIAHEECETFDINSSYPASMLEYGVPCGRMTPTNDFEENYPGIYRVRVRAPDDLIIPILPARNSRGSMRWYRGEFETVVTGQELQFAAQHGYEILELYEGYFFERIEFPFSDFITHCKLIRKAFKDLPPELIAKLMQNSLYGRFAARRDRVRLIHARTLTDEDFESGLLKPYDEAGLWYVKTELDEEMACLPQWATFITANSRLRLLRAAYAVGPQNVIYGDTDSLTIKKGYSHLIDVGDDYGQFKLEKEWEIFRAVAPKVYSGILGADILRGDGSIKAAKGSFLGAAKGLPRKGIKEKQWRELLEDGVSSAQTLSLASLKVAMRDGVQPAKLLTRKSSTLTNSMNFDACANGDVRVKFAHG